MINITPLLPPYNFSKPHIYRLYLIKTGKHYLGKHNGNNKNYKGSGKEWKEILKEHVIDFNKEVVKEILEYVEDITKLNEREEYWLNLVDAKNNPLYYNLTNKSRGIEFHSNITIEKMSLKGRQNKGKRINSHFKGKKLSETHILNNRLNKGNRINSGGKGIPKTKIHSMNISKSNKGISRNNKPIIQYDLEGNFIKEWGSVRTANSLYSKNIDSPHIGNSCNGNRKNAFGYIWKWKN